MEWNEFISARPPYHVCEFADRLAAVVVNGLHGGPPT
jgi:hypothetical protein